MIVFFFSSRRRHTRCGRDWSSDVCSSDLRRRPQRAARPPGRLGGPDHPGAGFAVLPDRRGRAGHAPRAPAPRHAPPGRGGQRREPRRGRRPGGRALMVPVYWLTLTTADLPADHRWLAAAEQARLAGLRVPKRRADWLLGRWTAKQAVLARLAGEGVPPALDAVEVHAAADGAPEAFLHGRPAGLSISLSHRAGVALCAVAPAGVALGCDLELVA